VVEEKIVEADGGWRKKESMEGEDLTTCTNHIVTVHFHINIIMMEEGMDDLQE
jgi:hypothetical protein